MPGSLAMRLSESSSTGRQYSVLRMPFEYASANSLVGCGHGTALPSAGAQLYRRHARQLCAVRLMCMLPLVVSHGRHKQVPADKLQTGQHPKAGALASALGCYILRCHDQTAASRRRTCSAIQYS